MDPMNFWCQIYRHPSMGSMDTEPTKNKEPHSPIRLQIPQNIIASLNTQKRRIQQMSAKAKQKN